MDSRIVSAVASGNLKLLERLLGTAGALQISSTLFLAVVQDRVEVVRWLVERKRADPREWDFEGRAPLHKAAAVGSLAIVRYLIERAAVDPGDVDGRASAMMPRAVRASFSDSFRLELQGSNALHWACVFCHTHVVDYLLFKTRINPLAKNHIKFHPLVVTMKVLQPGEAPDQGLPILDLFHRKAPKALETPAGIEGMDGALFETGKGLQDNDAAAVVQASIQLIMLLRMATSGASSGCWSWGSTGTRGTRWARRRCSGLPDSTGSIASGPC